MLVRFIVLAILVVAAPLARADIIEISGAADSIDDGLWEVTTVFGEFSAVADTLRSQVWWEDGDLAALFVVTLADSFGFPNAGGVRGPAFNVTEVGLLFGGSPPVQGWWWRQAGELRGYRASTSAALTWAVATQVEVPEPGTLVLLGIGLFGMGLARARRKV